MSSPVGFRASCLSHRSLYGCGVSGLLNIGVLGAVLKLDVMLGWLLSWLLGCVAALLRWDVGVSSSRWSVWIASLCFAQIMATASPSIQQTIMIPVFNVLSRLSVISAMVRGRLTLRRSMSAFLSAGAVRGTTF